MIWKTLLTLAVIVSPASAAWCTHFIPRVYVAPAITYHQQVTYATPVYSAPVQYYRPARRIRAYRPPAVYAAPPTTILSATARGCLLINGVRVCK